ncbi:MAG: hypothetical protein U1F56_02120 [Rubrivivax sp.]
MARAEHPRRLPLAATLAALCAASAVAQPAPAGSPSDVAYTPVQGQSSALFPRQPGDERPLAGPAAAVARVVVEVSADGLPADGQSVVRLVLRLFDASGAPLRGATRATVEHSGGRLRVPGAATDEMGPRALDADRASPGLQLTVQDGVAQLELLAPAEPQDVRLRVSAGNEVARGRVSFVPDLRPMVAAGLVEGLVHFRHRTTLEPLQRGDAFEREIRNWSRDFDGGRATAAARAALFLKGMIRGDLLLTAAYDSDKETRARLLRDIQPEALYPVYGDASLRSFDARSGSRLYLRLDQGRSYVLYGDFVTGDGFSQPLGQGAVASLKQRSLGAYARTATGVRAHHEGGGAVLNAWALRDTLRQVVEEFASQGSGPYALRNAAVLEGSEKVEVVVRDRLQPARIVAVRPLLRLVDYSFEPFSGRILLTQFLGAVDADLNPVSLRITYEVDQGGDAFWVGGADGQVRLGESLELGGSAVEDRNPLAPYRLASANATWKFGPRSALVVEAAGSRSEVNTQPGNARSSGALAGTSGRISGQAWRAELAHEGDGHEARVFVGRSDPAFDNPAAPLQGGRGEALASGRVALAPSLDAVAQAQRSEDRNPGGGSSSGADLGLRWRVAERWTLEAGVRTRRETVGVPGLGSSSLPFSSGAGLTSSLGSGAGGGALGGGVQALDPATGLPQVQGHQALSGAVSLLPVGTRLASDTVRLGLGWRAGERLTLGGEIEHEVDGDERRRIALGADWRLASFARMYTRWEQQRGWTSLQGVSALDGRASALVAGIAAEPLAETQVFSEYRLRDAVAGRELQLASGLRRQWALAEGLGLQAGLERIQVLQGNTATASAATLGLDWTAHALWRGSTRLEWRRSADLSDTAGVDERFDTWLWTALLARKIDRDWTLLARQHLLHTDYRSRGDVQQSRSQLGLAWRDTDTNRGNALARLEWKHESDASNEAVGTLKSRALVAALSAEAHPSRPWWLSGRLAGKWQRDRFEGGVDSSFRAQWASARLVWDLGKRWDLGLGGAVQRGQQGARQTAWGAELGYLLATNLWLSAGYNATGFAADRDLAGYEFTQRGSYLRLRFKFDETLFAGSDPAVNRSLPR